MTTEEYVEKFEEDMSKRSRVMRFLLVLDQMFNVLLWNGSQDETISSHVGRRIETGKATWFDKAVCRFLSVLESNHCLKSKGE
jgi:TFIIF-interacting CTD phosphatase-like protein